MSTSEALAILGELSSQQWGLATSAQAQAEGVGLHTLRRLAEQGTLTRVRHGVYASSSTALTPEVEAQAQWLALRPKQMAADRIHDPSLASEAVISHTTAAELWGIGDLWADGIHFTVAKRRQSRQPDVFFHRAELSEKDWVIHPECGLPVTTATRTIADLAQEGHGPSHLLGLVSDAAGKDLVAKEQLLDALSGNEDAFGVRKGSRQELDTLLGDYFPESESAREARLAVTQAIDPLQKRLTLIEKAMRSYNSEVQQIFAKNLSSIGPDTSKIFEQVSLGIDAEKLLRNAAWRNILSRIEPISGLDSPPTPNQEKRDSSSDDGSETNS